MVIIQQDKLIVGVTESIDLPQLGLGNVITRIDTGAKTSALHVDHIEFEKESGMVAFSFHPDFHDIEKTIHCSAKLHDTRWVKSSNGTRERRYVIQTLANIHDKAWQIELTLTDRSSMSHPMLLGREAMKIGILVDPERTFLVSPNPQVK